MISNLVHSFFMEIRAVENETKRLLVSQPYITDYLEAKREKDFWLALLCFSAASSKEVNKEKVLRMASILNILQYAVFIQNRLSVEGLLQNDKKKLQYTILFGDFIYSRVYAAIYEHEFERYFPYISLVIINMHKILMEQCWRRQKFIAENLEGKNVWAVLSQAACYLGAHLVQGNSETTFLVQRIGYQLGLLYDMKDQKDNDIYRSNWSIADEMCTELPNGQCKQSFQQIISCLKDDNYLYSNTAIDGTLQF